MLIASVLFAATGAFAKLLSSDMSSIEVVFFRNIIGFVLILFALSKKTLHQKGGRPAENPGRIAGVPFYGEIEGGLKK